MYSRDVQTRALGTVHPRLFTSLPFSCTNIMSPVKVQEDGRKKEDPSGSSTSGDIYSMFPLCYPSLDPLDDGTLISPGDVALEQDLLLNMSNIRSWNTYIHHVVKYNKPNDATSLYTDADSHLSSAQVLLLGPLASASNRLALRRITLAYERALAVFPNSYTLWKDYLLHRMTYVLGIPEGGLDSYWKKQIKIGRDKLEAGPTLLEGTGHSEGQQWDWSSDDDGQGCLDGHIGHREWESLASVFERALMYLPNVSMSPC